MARREAVLHDSAAVLARQDAIRNSTSWRILEIYRRTRIRLGISGVQSDGASRDAPREAPLHAACLASSATAPVGVNVSGYLDTESGMGEAARASIRSIQAAGLPLALNNVPSTLRAQDRSHRDAFIAANPHPFNLVHLNADNMGWFAALARTTLLPRSLHDRLLVLGAVDLPRRVAAVLRLRGRSLGRDRVRPQPRSRRARSSRGAHAAADRAAARAGALARALRPAGQGDGVPLRVRCVEPDRAQVPARRDPRVQDARRSRATRPCSCSSSPTPSTTVPPCGASRRSRRPQRRHARRLHGPGRAHRRCCRRPTAISRRIAPRASG